MAERDLLYAAQEGDLATLTRLVKEGVNLEATTNNMTALMYAAVNCKLNCLDHLIANGANLNAQPPGSNQSTALHEAAKVNHAPGVESLLKAGADASLTDFSGYTTLDEAQMMGRTEVVELLEKYTPAYLAAQAAAEKVGVAAKAEKAEKVAVAAKAAAEKAAAAALGLLQPLEALSLDADTLRAATVAAVAYCDAQGATSVADLVEYNLLDGLMASLTLKPIQANKLSQSLKGPAAAAPPEKAVVSGGAINAPGHWDFFLSHTQRDDRAVALAEMLCGSLKEMGKTVWLDVHMTKRDMAAMEEGAKNCKCFLAIVTDNGQDSYFSRPMCRDEIKWAQAAERTIVPVCGADDKKNVMALINGGKEHGIDFSSYNMVDIDRSAPRRLKASVEDILEQAGML